MVDELIKWDLSDFYKNIDDPLIDNDIEEIKENSEEFYQKVKGNLENPSLTPQQLLEWYQEYEKISEKVFYLDIYSLLIYSINTLDENVKSFHAKIEDFKVTIQEKLLFFNLELNGISDEKFEEFIKAPELFNYSHALKFNRSKKKHQLSEKEEQIILIKDITGVKGFQNLYRELKSSFLFDFEVEGQKRKLTEAELFAFMYQKDRDLRYKALQTLLTEYKNNEMVFTHIFTNILKNWDLECKKKNYTHPISKRNLQNEVSDEIVETLGNVTTESNRIVERYYNLKKKILNLPKLQISDMYAPVGEITREYSYHDALELIKTATENFYTEFKNLIDNMVKLNHIDATPRKGKNRGAFCEYGKLKHYPFVFVNFTNNVDSVRALAHELGHAFHAFYIQRDQNYINIQLSLVVAEIASIFNELLVTDLLLESVESKEEKVTFLSSFIESKFATSHRQNAFYQFERKMHELLEKKLPSAEEIKKTFAKEMELMFGNSINNIEKDYSSYCFVVPHFLQEPFYVYAYNMSNLLVISIYQMYLEQKEKFVPKYLKLLSIGSSLSPEKMLSEIDIDLNDSSFWQKGIKYLSDKIDELEKLVENN
ncbi:MAG: M3 family oligoendopeptidase [Promethearchaeota archaeon]